MNSLSSQPASSVLGQLSQCRDLALADPSNYVKIVPAVLTSTGPGHPLEERRWGADFLAETFASPVLANEHKQSLSLGVLGLLRQNLETPNEDVSILKNTVQIATSIYSLVFKHTIYHPSDAQTWQNMAAIKSNILRRMATSPAGIKVCCIKFMQRVVQVQTPGIIADPRRPDQNDVSLALVPSRHPLIVTSSLEAETTGLLDRLLNVFEQPSSDALYVTATLNCLGVLIRTRASVATKILQAILNFDPFRHSGSLTPQLRVTLKSKERTVKAFLLNLNKRNPNHPLAGRVHVYLTKLQQQRSEVMDGKRKVTAIEPTDGLSPEKRQKLGAGIEPPQLPPGPVSIKQLFTLTADPAVQAFDTKTVPFHLVSSIIEPLLRATDNGKLQAAVNTVRARWLDLEARGKEAKAQQAQPTPGVMAGPNLAAETVLNQFDSGSNVPRQDVPLPEMHKGRFKLPFPPAMNKEELQRYQDELYDNMFKRLNDAEKEPGAFKRDPKINLNLPLADRLTRYKFQATLIIRLITRPHQGRYNAADYEADDPDFEPNRLRLRLFNWIMADWRKRLDIATDWMHAEWHVETFAKQDGLCDNPLKYCYKWETKLLDAMIPYVDGKDKCIIRYFAEIMLLDAPLLDRIRKIAEDPDRAGLAVLICVYLINYREPVKETCLGILEGLYRNNAAAKSHARKFLVKLRPEVVEEVEAVKAEVNADVKTDVKTDVTTDVKAE